MSSLLIPEGTVVDPDKTFTLLERIGKGYGDDGDDDLRLLLSYQ